MKKQKFGTGALAIALLLSGTEVQADDLVATQYADFDRYVLALSWQNGFCQSQHDRGNREPTECRLQKEPADKTHNLTVHGLWPSLPKSVAARGVDQRRWMRYGCATRPIPNFTEVRTSRKCAAGETGLSLEMAAKLSDVMPGAGGESCLERYEYAKHGVCFGFDPDAWFGTMVRLNHEVKSSPAGAFLAKHYGETVTRRDFNAALNTAWGWNAVKSVSLRCEGNPAYLTEIQLTLAASKINVPLNQASFISQPHPGNCPDTFILDKVGY